MQVMKALSVHFVRFTLRDAPRQQRRAQIPIKSWVDRTFLEIWRGCQSYEFTVGARRHGLPYVTLYAYHAGSFVPGKRVLEVGWTPKGWRLKALKRLLPKRLRRRRQA
jgi:hypothetical protein